MPQLVDLLRNCRLHNLELEIVSDSHGDEPSRETPGWLSELLKIKNLHSMVVVWKFGNDCFLGRTLDSLQQMRGMLRDCPEIKDCVGVRRLQNDQCRPDGLKGIFFTD